MHFMCWLRTSHHLAVLVFKLIFTCLKLFLRVYLSNVLVFSIGVLLDWIELHVRAYVILHLIILNFHWNLSLNLSVSAVHYRILVLLLQLKRDLFLAIPYTVILVRSTLIKLIINNPYLQVLCLLFTICLLSPWLSRWVKNLWGLVTCIII